MKNPTSDSDRRSTNFERTIRSDLRLRQRLEVVAIEAMRSSGCSNSIICRATGDLATIVASGGSRLGDVGLQDCGSRAEKGPIVQSLGVRIGGNIRPVGAGADAVRFMVVSPIGTQTDLLLVLFDVRRRTSLSLATQKVLRVHASHLSTFIEISELEIEGRSLDIGQQGAQLAKFGLLESVAVFARDAILITEAEPIDAPGPRIIYCNAAFTEATGYSEIDVIGQSPRILQGLETSRASLDTLRHALES